MPLASVAPVAAMAGLADLPRGDFMVQTLLTVVFVIILIHGVLFVAGYFWRWLCHAPTAQDETHYCITDDGCRLAVHRYRPATGAKLSPVILCHGLAANRFIFDLPGAPSLARFLKNEGWDVWVPELRGAGMSARPGLLKTDVPYSWNFSDHLQYDLPGIVRYVLQRTGASHVHWVGHSMGGMLIQAALASNQSLSICSAVTIGSPVDFGKIGDSSFSKLLKLKWLLNYYPCVPLPFLARLLAPFAPGLANRAIGLFHGANIRPEAARALLTVASEPLGSRELWLEFGGYMETGVFGPGDGTSYDGKLPFSKVPLLVLSGSNDRIAPRGAVEAACKKTEDSGERGHLMLGKARGCKEDYGHVDLMIGKHAESEVFPHIACWLEEHDGLQTTA
jgi:pimeloyl-ACP methyl ester carboxylesterase